MAKENWLRRYYKICGSFWRQIINDPTIGAGGAAVSSTMSVADSGSKFSIVHRQDGRAQINCDNMIEMVAGGARPEEEGCDIMIKSIKGNIEIKCDKNGNVIIKGTDVYVKAGGDLDLDAGDTIRMYAENRIHIKAPVVDIDGISGSCIPKELHFTSRSFEGSFVGDDVISKSVNAAKLGKPTLKIGF